MANKIDLGGRNAVVTGGAQGIGRAIVERLLESGAAVAIWDRDGALAETDRGRARRNRGKVEAVASTSPSSPRSKRARDATVKALGRIDILVNNAGIAGPNVTTWEYPIGGMARGDARQSRQPVLLLPRHRAADDRAELRPHRQHRLDRRQGGQSERAGLFGVEGRRHRADQVARQGAGAATTSRSIASRRPRPRPRSSTR